MLYASLVESSHPALATPDIVIIGFYFALVFGIGMYFARRERTSEDYFLAGRNVGWFFIGASLFVSNISTEHFIGLSGTGASSGLAVGHFEWLACLILLILGWVFVPFYLRSNVFTMPEFLERRFNRQCAVYLAGISIIAYIFTKISVQLYAASVVLERVAGWKLWETAVVLVIATGIYTVAGGLAAVIYTDTVQTLILITGAVALTVIGLIRVGGLAHLRTMVPPDYFHMIKPASDPNFPWTGIFFGAPILGIWYRSEEHTSELQSHHDLVCRLLLDKKKNRRVIGHAYVSCSIGKNHVFYRVRQTVKIDVGGYVEDCASGSTGWFKCVSPDRDASDGA